MASWSFGEDFPLLPGIEPRPPGLFDSTVMTVETCGGVVGLVEVDDLEDSDLEVTDDLDAL